MIRRSVVSPEPKPPPPPLQRGSVEDLKEKLLRKPQTKPPPGFPKGTAVPYGFQVKTPGVMTFVPTLLPPGIIITTDQAEQSGLAAIPGP
eukprot:2028429-Amphidinium_carterae.1